jgi:hypothetical protein
MSTKPYAIRLDVVGHELLRAPSPGGHALPGSLAFEAVFLVAAVCSGVANLSFKRVMVSILFQIQLQLNQR